jgi:hypothetical protein
VSEEYRLIPLSRGQFAKVSPHRFDELNAVKWYAESDLTTRSCYARRKVNLGNGKQVGFLMHRVILGLEAGDPRQGEHVNCDTLDNRDENLRIANGTQNQGNKRLQKINTCGFKGVTWDKRTRKWMSQIKRGGKSITLGYFREAREAHERYCEAARDYFGEFARAD